MCTCTVHCLHCTVHFCNALTTALNQLLRLAGAGNCELLYVPNKPRKPQCQNISVFVFKLTTIHQDQPLFVSITILTTLFRTRLDAFASPVVNKKYIFLKVPLLIYYIIYSYFFTSSLTRAMLDK